MDIQSDSEQAINDDQELAKVLAGVSEQTPDGSDHGQTAPAMPSPIAPPTPMPSEPAGGSPVTDFSTSDPNLNDNYAGTTSPESTTPQVTDPALDSIKRDALNELRPLVDKLQVSPEEKFDTYLLLLRSTDDKELVAPAHEAAKAIPDETKRAQALLDIIKEIDFFTSEKN